MTEGEPFKKIERLTFPEAVSIFHELEGKNKGRNYAYHYKPLRSFFHDRPVDLINRLDVENYRKARELDGLKPTAINREHSVLTRIFNALEEWHGLGIVGPYNFHSLVLPPKNPGELVRKADERPYARSLVLTPMEFMKFCDYAHPRIRVICILAVLTLLRRKNLKMLNRENFNSVLKQITVTQSKTKIPLTIPASMAVSVIIDQSKYDCVCDFTNFRRLFQRARVESSVYFRLMDLRRTGATQMLLDGIDLRTIQRYLGHTTLVMTERYLSPPVQHMSDAAQKIEKKISSTLEFTGFSVEEKSS